MGRYLTESDARLALRQGRTIEQWLGHRIDHDSRFLQWLSISAERSGKYLVTILDVWDEGTEDFMDIVEFAALDTDQPYGRSEEFASAEEALVHATSVLNASPTAFVNSGMIEDEYRDFIKREGYWTGPGRF